MAVDVVYQGGKFAQRGYDMYREVERLVAPLTIFVSQGGYNVGGVAASAGTHDREAVDVSASLLTSAERDTVVRAMRRVGFAAWLRTPAQGFSYHVHGVPIDGDLSTAARAQVVAYYDGKNGLAGGGPDDGPRDYVGVTWEKYKAGTAYRPPIDTGTSEEDDMPYTEAQLRQFISQEVTKALRSEGVSGAADMGTSQRADGSWPTGAKILALNTKAIGDVLRSEGLRGIGDKIEAIRAKLGA